MARVDVRDQVLQLVFGPVRGEVGDLRLERTGQVGRGVGDVLAEFEDGVRAALEVRREFGRVGIEADAEQRIVGLPSGGEGFDEGHGGSSREGVQKM